MGWRQAETYHQRVPIPIPAPYVLPLLDDTLLRHPMSTGWLTGTLASKDSGWSLASFITILLDFADRISIVDHCHHTWHLVSPDPAGMSGHKGIQFRHSQRPAWWSPA